MSRRVSLADVRAVVRGEYDLKVRETAGRPNHVKYNTWYYGGQVEGDQYMWCAVFLVWCFRRAKVGADLMPTTASVSHLRDWFDERRRLFAAPLPGDIFIQKGPGVSHTGFVDKVLDGHKIQTLEGNYGNKVSKVLRRWGPGTTITQFCRPKYHEMRTSSPGRAPEGGYTSVRRTRPLVLPAGRFVTVQFDRASANTGRWWTAPDGHRNGYNLVTGSALFAGDISIEIDDLPPGAEIQYRFVETDPDKGYRVSKKHPISELSEVVGGTHGHATTVSRLDERQHLWVQVKSSKAVTVGGVGAKVIAFPDV
ncbi:CHAP domain-containing protein [Kineosporia sp. A_224]|uniref:CHAP domain-containing protein n=1 Tax=Kineosporia sp. A_224 TaxID=1962180 RepID=UPI000B4B03D6|nr:CHAP domain-containing protein [Kineosporia sp. A_224]